ncbi:MAG: hypothetical protein WAV05_13235, partial [Anaerolineales bacterium]
SSTKFSISRSVKLHPGAGQVSVTIPFGMASSPSHSAVTGVKMNMPFLINKLFHQSSFNLAL